MVIADKQKHIHKMRMCFWYLRSLRGDHVGIFQSVTNGFDDDSLVFLSDGHIFFQQILDLVPPKYRLVSHWVIPPSVTILSQFLENKLKNAGSYLPAGEAETVFEGRLWTYYLYQRKADGREN